MSQRKLKNLEPKVEDAITGKEIRPDPKYRLDARRRFRRELEELKVYKAIRDEEIDLARCEDLSYIKERAATLFQWSTGTLRRTLDKIFDDARKEAFKDEADGPTTNEIGADDSGNDAEVCCGKCEGIHNCDCGPGVSGESS